MRKNKPIKPLLTPWGEALDKQKPLNDYPRPQLARKEWQCLNGAWDYAITADKQMPKIWDGEIIVPFSPETILSNVQRQLLPGETLWYRKTFNFEQCKPEERLLLHFGAVDQYCTVYVNGKEAGSHSGGYWPFSFDISNFLNGDTTEIVIAVTDDTDTGDEAYGKQTLNRGEIWYTGQSGIWQTVWCEKVPGTHIEKINITPHYQTGEVEISVFITGADAGGNNVKSSHRLDDIYVKRDDDIRIKIFDSGSVIAEEILTTNPLRIKMPADFKSWSPEHPFLYDVEIRAGEDTLTSYFGMREFGIINGKHGPVLSLNGTPIFHHGLLDQGYWSDGMYTPPSDEAMIWEIKKLKDMGFNMLRKHIKIEPLRWYYHCDRLGMLVWQDFVSGGGPYKPLVVQYAPWLGFNFNDTKNRYALHGRKSEKGRNIFLRDAERTIDLLYNTVSLSVWVPFNEGWGQFEAASMAEYVHKKDPTRLIDHASGYFDQGAGDFHSYTFRKFGNLVGFTGGCPFSEVTTIDFIYLGKITQIVQEDRGFHHLVKGITCLFQNRFKALHHLFSLGFYTSSDNLACGRVYRNLSRNIKGAIGFNGLTVRAYRSRRLRRKNNFFHYLKNYRILDSD